MIVENFDRYELCRLRLSSKIMSDDNHQPQTYHTQLVPFPVDRVPKEIEGGQMNSATECGRLQMRRLKELRLLRSSNDPNEQVDRNAIFLKKQFSNFKS